MFKKKRHMKEEIDLQITAMASVFTVILVFLLKSMASDVSPVQSSANLDLPELSSAEGIENSFKVEITKEGIIFEGQLTEGFVNYEVKPDQIDVDGTFKELSKVIHDAQESKSEKGDKPLVSVFADKMAPQSLVQRAISSASKNGLTQIQMVVVHDEK